MENKDVVKTLDEIKEMMSKSSRFQSISGISIIIVGIYACIATALAALIIAPSDGCSLLPDCCSGFDINTPHRIKMIVLLGIALFAVSFLTVVLMAWRKSKRHQLRFVFDKRMFQMMLNFFIPLCVGGLFCIAMISQQHYGLTSSIMLIFYGLALLNCQHYTYPVLRFLGYGEILLGIADCFTIHYALIFWFIGFSLLHILFGICYTIKYDCKKTK